jgi:SfnB family sulfur acquisition oxidoreductase
MAATLEHKKSHLGHTPSTPAHRIANDAEAIEVALTLAREFAPSASDRDRLGKAPHAELERVARSGLLGLTIPKQWGGADVSHETIAEVFRILAVADPSIAQVPQNHFVFVEVLKLDGSDTQKQFFFNAILDGARFGNALSERHSKTVYALETRVTRRADGQFLLNGTKYYCTGALTATFVPVFALDEDDKLVVAYIDRKTNGVEIDEDWHAMGQRATVSGTTRLKDVVVPAERIVPHWRRYEVPQIFGAFGQIIHAAIDVGIARNALEDAALFVRTNSRPWFESGLDRAADEPHIIQQFGQLAVMLSAAEELLRKAGRTLDAAAREMNAESAAEASLAVAGAKAFGGDVAIKIASELFSLAGTRSADDRLNLHRHWRNARTHTLHDPNRWKYQHVGNFFLNGVLPPNHGLI